MSDKFTITETDTIWGSRAKHGGYETRETTLTLREASVEWLRRFVDGIPVGEYVPFPGGLLWDYSDGRGGARQTGSDLGTLQGIVAHYDIPSDVIPGHQGPLIRRR